MKKFVIFILCMMAGNAVAQTFSLSKKEEALSLLQLDTDSTHWEWKLKYPIYRFYTSDINGDGIDEAIIGVIKPTRYFHNVDKRLFIFKNNKGRIERMWMGSRVGGHIVDFCCAEGKIICVSKMKDNRYVVAKWIPARFGLEFVEYIAEEVDEPTAMNLFNSIVAQYPSNPF